MKKLLTMAMALLVVVGCCAGNVFAEKLVVATDTNFKPFSFKAASGEYTGFDVEMWAALAQRIGLDYQLQPMDFNGIIPGLQSGTIDVAVAGMSIKAAREEVVDFAYPYYKAGIVALVRADNDDIKSMEDFAGKIVATKLATSSVDYIKNNSTPKELKQFPNISDAFMELSAGGCDVVMFDLPPLADYANNAGKGQVKIVGPLYMGHHYGIAFPAGSELRDKVSVEILRMMEDGSYDELYRKWFGEDPK
jgi:glutamine transport system substrate-binding protein